MSGCNGSCKVGLLPSDMAIFIIIVVSGMLSTNADVNAETFNINKHKICSILINIKFFSIFTI